MDVRGEGKASFETSRKKKQPILGVELMHVNAEKKDNRASMVNTGCGCFDVHHTSAVSLPCISLSMLPGEDRQA